MVKATAEALGIFVTSVVILYLISIVLSINTHRATGAGWVHWKGFVLMIVGVFYLIFGFFLMRWRA